MPGVFRPMNLTDVLTSLTQQAADTGSDTVNGLAGFAEVSEACTVGDSMTATAQLPPGWGQATWGGFAWA